MSTGAERAAGIDDDHERVVGRLDPGRADPQPSGADRLVERAPSVLPPRLDVGSLTGAEEVPEALFAGGVGVRGELDTSRLLHLFEALREELDHRRSSVLGAVVP